MSVETEAKKQWKRWVQRHEVRPTGRRDSSRRRWASARNAMPTEALWQAQGSQGGQSPEPEGHGTVEFHLGGP